MFDSVRRLLPWAMAAAMVLTVPGQAALAQTDEEVIPAASIKAIRSTGNKHKRAGKLMAFAASGYLPDNIVKGKVATVAALKSTAGAVNEADNPVHWNQLQGVPAAVVNGTTQSFIVFETPVVVPGGEGGLIVAYPVGLDVETTIIPTAPDALFYVANSLAQPGHLVARSADGASLIEIYVVQNIGGVASSVKLRATVWNPTYLSPAAARGKVTVTFREKLPKKYRP